MASLRESRVAHQLRAISRTVVRPGGEKISQKVERSHENLTVVVTGTTHRVFVLGQHDIDSASPEYYIP